MSVVLEKDVLIVGGGHAGAHLAASLRKKGYTGSICVATDETLLPYERPPLSKAYFIGSVQIDRIMMRDEEFWTDNNIEFLLGRKINALDASASTAHLANGDEIRFSWCILATGGQPRKLSAPGADLPGVHYLRTVSDVDAIGAALGEKRGLVIIGGGYIGLEAAAASREMGHDVSVVEMQDRLLARVACEPVSEFFAEEHRKHGVSLWLGESVSHIEGDDCVTGVRLASGALLPGSCALVGIGLDPASDLAQAAGLECNDGIVVDASFRTSSPNILAIGDCARHPNIFANDHCRLESVQHAIDSAEVAADLICDTPREYSALPVFWSDQYDIRLQTAGIGAGADEIVVRGDIEARSFSALYLKDDTLIAIDTINNPKEFLASRKLITGKVKLDRDRIEDSSTPLKKLGVS